jgi:hypothetical protein
MYCFAPLVVCSDVQRSFRRCSIRQALSTGFEGPFSTAPGSSMTASLRRVGCRTNAPSYFANLEVEADSDVFPDSTRRVRSHPKRSHKSRNRDIADKLATLQRGSSSLASSSQSLVNGLAAASSPENCRLPVHLSSFTSSALINFSSRVTVYPV